MAARRGDTLLFPTPPVVAAHAAIGGKKEGEGPLAACFDELSADNFSASPAGRPPKRNGPAGGAALPQKRLRRRRITSASRWRGDLQAQCTASSYACGSWASPLSASSGPAARWPKRWASARRCAVPGMADGLLAMTSSHFCAAERQFRTPLSYGAVRTPTAQWTATAAGACLLRPAGEGVQLCAATFGRVQDYKIKDINNMGAAMAPLPPRPFCTI